MKVQIAEKLTVFHSGKFTIREVSPIDGVKTIVVRTREDAIALAAELLKWAQSQAESDD